MMSSETSESDRPGDIHSGILPGSDFSRLTEASDRLPSQLREQQSEPVRRQNDLLPQNTEEDDATPALRTRQTAPLASDWALDPDIVALTLGSLVRRPQAARSPANRVRAAFAVVLAISAVAGGAMVMMMTRSAEEVSDAVPIDQSPLMCEAQRTGRLTVGNGPGGTATGADAILGFQYAYYIDRAGEAAWNFVAPDAVDISSAQNLQQAIEAEIPVGTTHCVRIAQRQPDSFDVDVEERRPDGMRVVYEQHVRTAVRDGHTLIYAIFDR
ncbi:hypothetical protein IU479_35545 [Nocardia abscessus]|uniref:hypothetical protein n=2 Tax=Nocardia TaxID=1817 RepID=UPI001D6750D2|nr:hypothetical protein [Nocardia abscessus]MBF6223385.1 hypothetical protein [Nocardia abscessus]